MESGVRRIFRSEFARKGRQSVCAAWQQRSSEPSKALPAHTWRDPCIITASFICEHVKQKHRCPVCRPNRPRCKHGILNRHRCSQCLREKAEEKVAASSEEPSPPAVRASTGRKVFPGGPWPMGLMRASPELA